jgi:opacity protein-like surface antigen
VDADFNRDSGVVLQNSSSFAWQPIGGVSLQLTEIANFYVEYRYFSTTDLEVTQFGELQDNSTYNAHDLFMGMRFEF